MRERRTPDLEGPLRKCCRAATSRRWADSSRVCLGFRRPFAMDEAASVNFDLRWLERSGSSLLRGRICNGALLKTMGGGALATSLGEQRDRQEGRQERLLSRGGPPERPSWRIPLHDVQPLFETSHAHPSSGQVWELYWRSHRRAPELRFERGLKPPARSLAACRSEASRDGTNPTSPGAPHPSPWQAPKPPRLARGGVVAPILAEFPTALGPESLPSA